MNPKSPVIAHELSLILLEQGMNWLAQAGAVIHQYRAETFAPGTWTLPNTVYEGPVVAAITTMQCLNVAATGQAQNLLTQEEGYEVVSLITATLCGGMRPLCGVYLDRYCHPDLAEVAARFCMDVAQHLTGMPRPLDEEVFAVLAGFPELRDGTEMYAKHIITNHIPVGSRSLVARSKRLVGAVINTLAEVNAEVNRQQALKQASRPPPLPRPVPLTLQEKAQLLGRKLRSRRHQWYTETVQAVAVLHHRLDPRYTVEDYTVKTGIEAVEDAVCAVQYLGVVNHLRQRRLLNAADIETFARELVGALKFRDWPAFSAWVTEYRKIEAHAFEFPKLMARHITGERNRKQELPAMNDALVRLVASTQEAVDFVFKR